MNTSASLAALRKEYALAGLRRRDLQPDPLAQFQAWLEAALAAGVPEPTAMTLATADAHGRPSARTVLLKGIEGGAFVFFTNYESRKGRELAVNPAAALVFHWKELERQVCVRGAVRRASAEAAAAYFQSRPVNSRRAAWASARQSEAIASREALDARLREIEARFPGEQVPLPPFWGGYLLAPETIEFWQGRPSRLHDRFQYTRQQDGTWALARLSP